MLYSRHDFIFPSLTFWSSLSCKVELKLQFLYYYQWNIQMIYCTLLLIEATKAKVQASSNFLDVLAKIIFAIVLFGKLLMDPDDKIQRFITALLRFCLVRFFVVKCLIFSTFIEVLDGSLRERVGSSEHSRKVANSRMQLCVRHPVSNTCTAHMMTWRHCQKVHQAAACYVERGSVQNQQRRGDRPGVGGIEQRASERPRLPPPFALQKLSAE